MTWTELRLGRSDAAALVNLGPRTGDGPTQELHSGYGVSATLAGDVYYKLHQILDGTHEIRLNLALIFCVCIVSRDRRAPSGVYINEKCR